MRRTRKGYAASPRKGDATSVARRSRERLSSVRRQSRQRLRNCPVEKKKCYGGSVCAGADLLPPAGEGWPSLTVIRDGNALPLGSSKPGEVPDTVSADFTRKGDATSVTRRSRERLSSIRRQSRCRWTSLAGQGPTLRSAPTKRWGLLPSVGADLCVRPLERPFAGPKSGSGNRSRGHAIFRPGFPPRRARGAKLTQMSGPTRAGRRPAVFTGTDSGDPRPRGGPLHRSATKKRPFLLDRPRPIFFSTRRKRKWGVDWTGYHHSRMPGRQIAAPTPLRRRAPAGAGLGAASALPLALVFLPPRRERRVFRGEGRGDLWGNSGNVTFFFVEWKKNCSLPV